MARIINIEGIGPHYKQALKEKAGITETEALLEELPHSARSWQPGQASAAS